VFEEMSWLVWNESYSSAYSQIMYNSVASFTVHAQASVKQAAFDRPHLGGRVFVTLVQPLAKLRRF
jgi:hypothetical protein